VTRSVVVVGGGWAGLSAAVHATQQGWQVTLMEGARQWGGRARRINATAAQTCTTVPDNGQHILIGAYTETLRLMELVGVDVAAAFETVALDLRFADGQGLCMPHWARRWPASAGLLAASVLAQGWSWHDRWQWIRLAARWQWQGFRCEPTATVADLCRGLSQTVVRTLIEPLCVAALNTPHDRASGTVFLTVLRDALLGPGHGPWRASDLLVPRWDLSRLLPEPAIAWLTARGAQVHLGQRADTLTARGASWTVATRNQAWSADAVILASPAHETARLLASGSVADAWQAVAGALHHEPIATVYLKGELTGAWPTPHSMVALHSDADRPAQFAFLRSRSMGGGAHCGPGTTVEVAVVASACHHDREALQAGVIRQAAEQLPLQGIQALLSVHEKRATLACTPGLRRPPAVIAGGLLAAGDYVDGPYPSTLEGAVRSGRLAAALL